MTSPNCRRATAWLAWPLRRFLAVEAAGGLLLALAAVAALVWVNVFSAASYESVWSPEVRFELGSYVFAERVGNLVNDLLMALFFFVAGMEIKRELLVGDLGNPRVAALPVLAALGGMIVPAVVYAAFNAGGAGADGWGIPMATDIAFAVGVVAILGDRVPAPAKLMLLSLAIVDDIGAIAVIAVFYSEAISFPWLLAAVAAAALLALLHRLEVTFVPVLVIAALALWLTVYEAGVHATIAGVIAGLLMPVDPRPGTDGYASRCDRAIAALHPWTSYAIVPLFALANAGIDLDVDGFTSPSHVFVGVAAGLVLGKPIGIVLFAFVAVRLGVARMPEAMTPRHLIGIGVVAGIGFTVSLFVATLALDSDQLADAKAGILTASVIATAAGLAVLATARPAADSS